MSDLDIKGEVLTLSSEGQGIVRHDNLVVFIPFTAPGDIVLFRIVQQKKKFANGELLKVLQPSPFRTTPLCRYYGHCGGCQLQHITYETQLDSKRQIIEDALQRIGKFTGLSVKPVVPAQQNWAYRRHITLKIRSEGKALVAGYVAMDNKSLIQVEHCPIFISESDLSIQELQTLLKKFSAIEFSEGTAILFKTENDQLILSLYFERMSFKNQIIENFLKEHPRWIGIVIHVGRKKSTWGQTTSTLTIDDNLSFIASPDVFTQNHPEQSLKIYQHISQIVLSKPGSKVFDLYCGIGISSLLLAKQGHAVIGVEYNPEAIQLAQENARLNHLSSAQFIVGDVEQVLTNNLKKERADTIVINPPRMGLTPKVINELLKRKPKEIIYISCMPSTLARDLKLLCADVYKIVLVQPYDMFPQTSHVETLVHLS